MGDARDYVFCLRDARERHGLHLSLHAAEVPSHEETSALLDLAVASSDRLGHATCVHPLAGGNRDLWRRLLEARVPVEVCLTSNLLCGTVSNDLSRHHAALLHREGHPLALCTDDRAVFDCELSGEYELFTKHCLGEDEAEVEMFAMSTATIEMIFAEEDVKERLREEWRDFATKEGLKRLDMKTGLS